MKKNIILIIQFLILIFAFSYSIKANQETIIDASDVSYGKTQSVKDKLDELYGTSNDVIYNGSANQADVFKNKTGISRGKFIVGNMNDYSSSTVLIKSIKKYDNDTLIFDMPENGYCSSNTIFAMNFGNKRKIKLNVNGYLNTTNKVKVPSSWIKMYVDFKVEKATVTDSSGIALGTNNKLPVEFGKTATFKVTPSIGYRLNGITCTNGYTVSTVKTGNNDTGEQTITITNPGTTNDTVCTVGTSPRVFTLTYNANGGSVSPTTKQITYDSTYGSMPMPTLTGNIHKGWFSSASGGTEYISTSIVKVTSNQEIYSHWQACTACSAGTGATCSLSVVNNTCTYSTSCQSGYENIVNNGSYNPSCSISKTTQTFNWSITNGSTRSTSINCDGLQKITFTKGSTNDGFENGAQSTNGACCDRTFTLKVYDSSNNVLATLSSGSYNWCNDGGGSSASFSKSANISTTGLSTCTLKITSYPGCGSLTGASGSYTVFR